MPFTTSTEEKVTTAYLVSKTDAKSVRLEVLLNVMWVTPATDAVSGSAKGGERTFLSKHYTTHLRLFTFSSLSGGLQRRQQQKKHTQPGGAKTPTLFQATERTLTPVCRKFRSFGVCLGISGQKENKKLNQDRQRENLFTAKGTKPPAGRGINTMSSRIG